MRIHATTAAVLETLLRVTRPEGLYGMEIMEASGVRSGTLYPILERLEREGLVRAQWGDQVGKTRRRRYYTLTASGATKASEVVGRRPAFRPVVT